MASKRAFAKMEKTPKFSVRQRNRCKVCGRPRGYYRKFEMCRRGCQGMGSLMAIIAAYDFK